MPSYVRGTPRNLLRFVAINDTLYYGFRTKADWGNGITSIVLDMELGQEDLELIQDLPGLIIISGANSPKPPRFTKKFGNAGNAVAGSVSSFCAYHFSDEAVLWGWKLSKVGRGIRLSNWSGSRTMTAIAELSNGLLYAFPLNRADFNAVAADLGLQSAGAISATERKKIAFGCNTKPGEAAKRADNGTLSTYYSTAQQATLEASDEWKIISTEQIEFPPI